MSCDVLGIENSLRSCKSIIDHSKIDHSIIQEMICRVSIKSFHKVRWRKFVAWIHFNLSHWGQVSQPGVRTQEALITLIIYYINTLMPRQNGRHFQTTFSNAFLNEIIRISIKISFKFVPRGPINNIPALVQIMAWRRPGDKPLSEPMMVSSLTHICVTRPKWVNLCHAEFISGNIKIYLHFL